MVLAIRVASHGATEKTSGEMAGQFAWIVPFPNPPEVAREDARLFEELRRYVSTGPEPRWSVLLRPKMYGRSGPKSPVEVIQRKCVGTYDVAVVRENKLGALNRWLAREGFRTLDSAGEVIGHYREKGFVFACVKVRDAAVKPGATIDLHPLRFTFETGRPGQLYSRPIKARRRRKSRAAH